MADTTMDPSAPRQKRLNNVPRPQLYVHVEVGMSWTGKEPPRPHAVTYRSRGLRERSPNFPRHVPPSNTNYLTTATGERQRRVQIALPSSYQQENRRAPPQNPARQSQSNRPQQPRGGQPQQSSSQPYSHGNPYQHPQQQRQQHQHQHQQRPQPHPQLQVRQGAAQQEGLDRATSRSSRSSRSSHERGRSAPPPINGSPWDVEQPAMASSSRTPAPVQADTQAPPQIWKALPEVPNRFRLGEDGLPWSAWSWPMSYEPAEGYDYGYDYEVDDLQQMSPGGISTFSPDRSDRPAWEREVDVPHSPSLIAIAAPADLPHLRGEDPRRVRELENLSAAMMTVDNGFEHQWWNQGERHAFHGVPTITTRGPDGLPASAPGSGPEALGFSGLPPPSAPFYSEGYGSPIHLQQWPATPRSNLGWAVASPMTPSAYQTYSPNNAVSPMTSSAQTPPYHSLTRSMSTRSEELFFTGGRYA